MNENMNLYTDWKTNMSYLLSSITAFIVECIIEENYLLYHYILKGHCNATLHNSRIAQNYVFAHNWPTDLHNKLVIKDYNYNYTYNSTKSKFYNTGDIIESNQNLT